jgi:hypothetical protein
MSAVLHFSSARAFISRSISAYLKCAAAHLSSRRVTGETADGSHDTEPDVSRNLDTTSALHHNSGMKRLSLSGVTFLVALATLTRSAPACGDPPVLGVAGTKAQLLIQAREGSVRIGEPVFANLILPKDSPLPTGTLNRASCTSLQFTVTPASGWHDPWSDWYYSGIPQHATGRDGPDTCGVTGVMKGMPIPPPQMNFTLNDWIEFERPGKYKISVTYRTQFRTPQEVLDDPYDDGKSAVNITLATEPVEIEVLPESPDVTNRVSDALAVLRSHFRDDDPWSFSPDPTPFPVWTQYSHSEAAIPLLAQFYEQNSNVARRGLIASPHRKLVVQAMEKELLDPRHSVDFNFPAELAFIAAEVQHPELFGGGSKDWRSPEWEQASMRRNELFHQLLAEYTRKLLSAIPRKHEDPRRDSLSAALVILARWDLPGKAQLRKQAADEAARLIPKMKEAPILGEDEWKIVATPALLPYLRKTEPHADQMHWLYQLAPQRARQSMIHSALGGDWATVTEWATVVPEDERPSAVLDSHLAKALRQEPDDELENNLDQILLRLGGSDLIAPVRQILASESCMGRPALWAFLLKREGEEATRRLIRSYHQNSADPACDAELPFQQIWLNYPVRYWSLQVEAIVVSQLDKTDSLATGAAGLLERLGSKDSEPALWARLEKWHRSPPMRPVGGEQPIAESDDLEATLVSALLDGPSWSPEPERIDRLRHLCIYQCDSLKWALSTKQIQRLVIWDEGHGDVRFVSISHPVNIHECKRWIQRFPAGTRFVVTMWPGNAPLTAAQVDARYPNLGELMRNRKLEILNVLPYDGYGRCKDSHPDWRGVGSELSHFLISGQAQWARRTWLLRAGAHMTGVQ